MLRSQDLLREYDLSSVMAIFTGAAPLGAETSQEIQRLFPHWAIRQGYGKACSISTSIPTIYNALIQSVPILDEADTQKGLTETSTVVTATSATDIWFGSSGNILPGVEARIISPDGKEILDYDTPGELVVRSPSVVLGYLRNEKATKETFRDGWMFTGDEAVIRVSSQKTEHVWIVDRIKELIKVKVF